MPPLPMLAIYIWLAAVVGACCNAPANAQTSPSPLAILPANNPIIAALERSAPDYVSSVKARLEPLELAPLSTGTTQGGRRGGDPTAAELAQINANTDFKRAYQRRPDETVELLRQVNGLLAAAGGRAPGR